MYDGSVFVRSGITSKNISIFFDFISKVDTLTKTIFDYFLSHDPVDLFLKWPLGQRLRFVFFFIAASIDFISALVLRFLSVYFFLYFLARSLRDLHCLIISLQLIPLISCWTWETLSLMVFSAAKSAFNAYFLISRSATDVIVYICYIFRFYWNILYIYISNSLYISIFSTCLSSNPKSFIYQVDFSMVHTRKRTLNFR